MTLDQIIYFKAEYSIHDKTLFLIYALIDILVEKGVFSFPSNREVNRNLLHNLFCYVTALTGICLNYTMPGFSDLSLKQNINKFLSPETKSRISLYTDQIYFCGKVKNEKFEVISLKPKTLIFSIKDLCIIFSKIKPHENKLYENLLINFNDMWIFLASFLCKFDIICMNK